MIRYYKLFDLLNRRGMNKSSLLKVISSKTIAKLSKGDNVETNVIDKICLFLQCQPSDIMEVIEIENIDETSRLIEKKTDTGVDNLVIKEIIGETKSALMSFGEANEEHLINQTQINVEIERYDE